MRLIDADALKDRLQALAYDDWNQGVCTSWADAYREVAEMVEDQPTIEAVPTGCEGCVYDVDDHTPDPCYECKRSYPDNYKERTDETD